MKLYALGKAVFMLLLIGSIDTNQFASCANCMSANIKIIERALASMNLLSFVCTDVGARIFDSSIAVLGAASLWIVDGAVALFAICCRATALPNLTGPSVFHD
jgi:hypothetical protein